MTFDIEKISRQLQRTKQLSKQLDQDELVKRYGTFLDSKKDVLQLYILFSLFGILCPSFKTANTANTTPYEYDPD